MKLIWLTEYNMINIYFEKLSAKCGGETFPSPYSKVLHSLILLYAYLRAIEIYQN